MATDTQTTATGRGWKPYRLTVEQFLKMIGAGVFPHDARVELLGGILVERMTRYAPHNYCVLCLGRTLNRLLPAEWLVSEEKPIEFGRRWRPEPDFAIIKGPETLYRARTPTLPDIGFLVEVSDSTYAADRGAKWRAYAAARIPIYWIVNIQERWIEVYRDPAVRGRSAGYRQSEIFREGTEMPIIVDGQDVGRIAVRDILT